MAILWDIKVDGVSISWSKLKVDLKLEGLNTCTITTHLEVDVNSLESILITFDGDTIFEGLITNRVESESSLTIEGTEYAWELSRKPALGPSGLNCLTGEADCLSYTFPTSTMKDIVETLVSRFGWTVGYTEDNPSVQDFAIDGESALGAVTRLVKVIGKMDIWFDESAINWGTHRDEAAVPVETHFKNWKYTHDDIKRAECAAVIGKTSPDPEVGDVFGAYGVYSDDKFFEVFRRSEVSTNYEAVDFAKKIVAKQGYTIDSFDPNTLVLIPIREATRVSYDSTVEVVERARYSVGASGTVKLGLRPPGMPKVHGDLLYWDGLAWSSLHPGVAGRALTTNGVGSPPSWEEIAV